MDWTNWTTVGYENRFDCSHAQQYSSNLKDSLLAIPEEIFEVRIQRKDYLDIYFQKKKKTL